jgi:hypothetical protein
VEILALILANPARASTISGTMRGDGYIESRWACMLHAWCHVPCIAACSPGPCAASSERWLRRATLVVCAVSLVGQWAEEAQSKLGGSLSIYQYHGQGRLRDAAKLATNYDIVVTTYQARQCAGGLFNLSPALAAAGLYDEGKGVIAAHARHACMHVWVVQTPSMLLPDMHACISGRADAGL